MMQRDEILRIIKRITRDFAPLLPGLRLEVVPPEGFRARVRGKPIVADESTLRAVLVEEAAKALRRKAGLRDKGPLEVAPRGSGHTWSGGGWNRSKEGTPPGRAAGGGGIPLATKPVKGEGRAEKTRETKDGAFAALGAGTPEAEKLSPPGARSPEEEHGEHGAGERTVRKDVEGKYLLYALPSSRTILVEMEGLTERVNREDRRLHRPLVEGLVLREVLYLITSGQPLPEPRARAERILRRHWPFQYAALRSVGLTVTGFEKPPGERALGRDN